MRENCKEILLTKGKVAIVDEQDYEALSAFNWFFLENKKKRTGYAARTDKDRKTVLMHRQILNSEKGQQTDHKDGDGLNNRRDNLRSCTHLQNQYNRDSPRKSKTSKFKGVCKVKNKKQWRVRIAANGKQINLGSTLDEELAARMYDAAAIKYHGEFAWLNFPQAEQNHA
jgi:hypothetical protein